MNDKEQAFSWLDRGLATGVLAVFYKDEPIWDPIRDDPRFVFSSPGLRRNNGVPETAQTRTSEFEIGDVVFIDNVGYSERLIEDQKDACCPFENRARHRQCALDQ